MFWRKQRYAPADPDEAVAVLDELAADTYSVEEFLAEDGLSDMWKYPVVRQKHIVADEETLTVDWSGVAAVREANDTYTDTSRTWSSLLSRGLGTVPYRIGRFAASKEEGFPPTYTEANTDTLKTGGKSLVYGGIGVGLLEASGTEAGLTILLGGALLWTAGCIREGDLDMIAENHVDTYLSSLEDEHGEKQLSVAGPVQS